MYCICSCWREGDREEEGKWVILFSKTDGIIRYPMWTKCINRPLWYTIYKVNSRGRGELGEARRERGEGERETWSYWLEKISWIFQMWKAITEKWCDFSFLQKRLQQTFSKWMGKCGRLYIMFLTIVTWKEERGEIIKWERGPGVGLQH